MSVRAVTPQVIKGRLTGTAVEVFAPDCKITVCDAVVRGPDGTVIGRVVNASYEGGAIEATLDIWDERAKHALLGSLPRTEGEGLGWDNGDCSDKHQDCNGTYDPERGCHCV